MIKAYRCAIAPAAPAAKSRARGGGRAISIDSGESLVFNHEPEGYSCPFCRLTGGGADDVNSQADIVRRSGPATAFISPRWWPNNHGHVLVVPDAHHENLYDLPSESGHAVHDLVREVAVAIRETYGCEGTSVRQHNEPAGNQDAWHYHVHVFPRYPGDGLYGSHPYPEFVSTEARRPFAERLRGYFAAAGSGSR